MASARTRTSGAESLLPGSLNLRKPPVVNQDYRRVHYHPVHGDVSVTDYSYAASGFGYWGFAGIACTIFTLFLIGVGIALVWMNVRNGRTLNMLSMSQRFCFEGDGDAVLPGPGDADGRMFGEFSFNLITSQVSWSALYTDTVEPTVWALHGPLTEASPLTAPAAIPLGVASASGPDGTLEGVAAATATVQAAVLAAPSRYYLQASNGAFPAGALRAPLSGRC